MSEERAVHVGALAGDTVSFSWARDLTPTMPLSTLEYKWVPANCWGKPNKLSHPGEVEILTSQLHATETGIISSSYEPESAKRLHF